MSKGKLLAQNKKNKGEKKRAKKESGFIEICMFYLKKSTAEQGIYSIIYFELDVRFYLVNLYTLQIRGRSDEKHLVQRNWLQATRATGHFNANASTSLNYTYKCMAF